MEEFKRLTLVVILFISLLNECGYFIRKRASLRIPLFLFLQKQSQECTQLIFHF